MTIRNYPRGNRGPPVRRLQKSVDNGNSHDQPTQVRSRGGSMEEAWTVQLSSSEATASDFEEVTPIRDDKR